MFELASVFRVTWWDSVSLSTSTTLSFFFSSSVLVDVLVIDAHLFWINSLAASFDSILVLSCCSSMELTFFELLLSSSIVIALCLLGLLFSSSVGDLLRLLPVFLFDLGDGVSVLEGSWMS